ncbi:MAG: malonyl-ACP O-methyltransferase BioC [Steroidobacteraceae bacterium]
MTIRRNSGQGGVALSSKAVRRSFDAASADYDAAAVLQKEVRGRLLERLDFVKLEPAVILDLGAGTGHASRSLKDRYPGARVIALDLAQGMLVEAKRRVGWFRRFERVCADAGRLPLKDRSVDLVVSNLMLQWCDPPDAVLNEVKRILKPGGLFTFTSLGPDTLRELRVSWSKVDDHPHVHRFIDMHDLGDALVRAGLAEPVLDVENFTLTYQDARSLMRELKTIGARNAAQERSPGLTGRGALRLLENAYEQFRQDGVLPATYEVVYGQAWGRLTEPRAVSGGSEVRIPVDSLRRR